MFTVKATSPYKEKGRDRNAEMKYGVCLHVSGGSFPVCEDIGRMFDNSFPACAFFFFLSGDLLAHTDSTL